MKKKSKKPEKPSIIISTLDPVSEEHNKERADEAKELTMDNNPYREYRQYYETHEVTDELDCSAYIDQTCPLDLDLKKGGVHLYFGEKCNACARFKDTIYEYFESEYFRCIGQDNE